ncbi:beta-1,3-galactosyl-O-glycosyl-glycoprotein beta-1,6-N-acetylglucosaminyltransferase 3-like [Chiloscyllium plagiosum]|uniref:beta-1,3-galactosyl-O-glycosyl-glycoprotein beta-1,6-N-acetylglucosaminyltransferase 3-like n=1 Tax=Chiloscyllium plagiosum TaxID=36176 RepID=UPI001CB87881|nr:beta-1,3-galactosyl-O-glycosyl-glycoprotein beta-1,6-N-acetylglucosaminyltransferase 3-like [Chiloscyllium plagiosum]
MLLVLDSPTLGKRRLAIQLTWKESKWGKNRNGGQLNNSDQQQKSAAKQKCWQYHHDTLDQVVLTVQLKDQPNISTSIFVGSAYFLASREFVGHVFDSAKIQAFLKLSEDTYSPDEHVWATLHRMPNVPGSIPYTQGATRTLGRAVKWSFEAGDVARGALYPPCTGKYRHLVCVYGAGDLHWVVRQRCFFANKFDPNMDNMAVQCMEEYLRNRTLGKTGAVLEVGTE